MHVLPTIHASRPHIDELELVAGELQRAGAAVVGEAARTMQRLLPDDLVVSTELRHGSVFSCLVEASAHACLLVLQHRDTRHDGVSHLLPTIHSVVASAHCPVLVVPQTWQSEESDERPLVLAGVDDGTRSAHVVQLAMAEASRRHARVRLVHGAKHPLGGVEENDATPYAAWLRQAQRELEAEFSALTGSQTDVAVELEVVPEAPATALVAKARGAAVVVMGRGHRGLPFVKRLGPVTGEVLRHAACPVLVANDSPPARSAPTGALAGRHRMNAPGSFVPRPPVFRHYGVGQPGSRISREPLPERNRP
jgi:nucleotide-binding universal stress UspA family protein